LYLFLFRQHGQLAAAVVVEAQGEWGRWGRPACQARRPEHVYNVPWRVRLPELPPVTTGLVLYWFPSSVEEVKRSSLRTSRVLSLYAAQCVSMEIVDADSTFGKKWIPDAKLPIAVLATPDGTLIGQSENKGGFLRANQVRETRRRRI
jgi:hypothetical protein